jgi:UDP-N-acetylmuramate dehydrogenase
MSERPAIIQENISLAPHTTLQIGGPARFFAAPTTVDEIRQCLVWASENKIPWRVIGRGANLVVADAGYNGLIIIMRNDKIEWNPPTAVAGAGVQNGQLIADALQHNLGGLQWLIGVPGTIGGSLYGNAGGHGWGLGDMVDWVEVLMPAGELKRLTKAECEFAYRTSVFKKHPDWIIVQAQFTFPAIDPVAERQLLTDTTKAKNTNQPTTEKTAGCMFTNPIVSRDTLPEKLKPFVDAEQKISAWRLIEEVDLKGKQLGKIQISEKHSNFMINLGGGTADQVMQLISLVKQKVRDTLKIQLQEEIQYLGFE